MAEGEATVIEPLAVEYDSITGIPSEFNEFLPKDCAEFKNWKAAKEGGDVEGAMGAMKIGDDAAEKESKSGKKKKKKNVPMIVLERNTRNKRKCITTISGLDLFGVKLNEAAKMFGKKFASGASVTKNAENKEQIDCQGDFLDQAVELILKQYKEVSKKDIYHVESKKKVPYFPEEVAK